MTPRCCRNLIACLSSLLLLQVAAGPARAQVEIGGEDEAALRALRQLVQLEADLLAQAQVERLDALELLRQAAADLEQSATLLSRAIQGTEGQPGDEDLIAEAASQLASRKVAIETALESSRALGRRVEEHARRLNSLRDRLARLEAEAPDTAGPLSGTWRVTINPGSEGGELAIRQFGTLFAGQYDLGSGRTGSLRGTIVSGRIKAEAIDSAFGKDRVFFGLISDDENELTGTWEATKLGTGRPAFGEWKARRKTTE
ncbi:MAG: hypothetical protein AAF533_26020 [Acidobacteriota bacterium]